MIQQANIKAKVINTRMYGVFEGYERWELCVQIKDMFYIQGGYIGEKKNGKVSFDDFFYETAFYIDSKSSGNILKMIKGLNPGDIINFSIKTTDRWTKFIITEMEIENKEKSYDISLMDLVTRFGKSC